MANRAAVLKQIVGKTVKLVEAETLQLDIIEATSVNVTENTFTSNGKSCKLMVPASNAAASVGILEQKFTMHWKESGEKKEIEFNGLSGTLSGQHGCPGVVHDSANKTIKVNLLLSRPDSSFAIACSRSLCMVVAPPTHEALPDFEKMTFAKFTNGVCLPQGWWHSVPFPAPGEDKIELTEWVADTNQNDCINLAEEAGAPITIQL